MGKVRLVGLLALVLLAQACGGSGSRHTAASSNQAVISLRGITVRQDLPAGCSGDLTAKGPGLTQVFPLPPLEQQLSLAAGIWALTARLTCGGESSTGETSVTVVPPNPVNVSVQVQGHGNVFVVISGNGSVGSAPGGIACPSDCSETFTIGSKVTLTAVGENFTGYQGGGCGSNPVCQVSVGTTPVTITASFAGPTPKPTTPGPTPPGPTPPPPPTTGSIIVSNVIPPTSCCTTISEVDFAGPGSISPILDLVRGGPPQTRTGVTPGSYTATYCGSNVQTFSVTAGLSTPVGLDQACD